MLDTIILTIPRNKVVSVDLTEQGVQPWRLHSMNEGYEKYVKNPSNRDKATGLYFPRLTGIKRDMGIAGSSQTVKIEFSAPKLLHLNNLDELEEEDFEKIIEILEERMKRMGVFVSQEILREASVSGVHYSKNIQLFDGYTSQYVLSELGRINLNKRFDLTRARYMNDGQSVTLYTIAHSIVLYDKIADLTKSKKRAIDKEQSPYQISLFDQLNKKDEILRFEIRLSKKQKMNSLFVKLGYPKNPTFRDVFSLEKSQKILLHYWENIIKDHSILLFAYSFTSKDLLKQILLTDKNIKPKQALYLIGLIQVAKEGNGIREARSIISKYADDRTWYRIIKDYREANERLSAFRPRDWLDQMDKQLRNYSPFRIHS